MALDYSKFELFNCEVKEQILIISNKTVDGYNPIGWTQIREMKEIFGQVKNDGDVRAVIWRSDGEFFTRIPPGYQIHPVKKEPVHPLSGLELAGIDIHQEGAYHMSIIQSILDVPQPMIVTPYNAIGGLYTNMMLCFDFIISADDATFSDTHCAGGMACGDGGAVLWPLLLNPLKSKQYLLGLEAMPAVDAERFGLVTKVVPRADIDKEAWDLAKRLATSPTMAIRFTKHAINRHIWQQMNYTWEFADALQMLSCYTWDNAELRKARQEGRAPELTGF